MSRSVLLKMENRNGKAARERSQRQPELDALRGLLLIGMTLTHLPTHASLYAYQPFGFVAAAEGFILVSAMLTGRIYGRTLPSDGIRVVARRLWERAAKLYSYHLLLLLVAFTVVAFLAVKQQQPALQGLLDFYLAHRGLAVVSSALLIYCPPLLDILPMYIVFLLLTPVALFIGRRWGWRYVLAPAALLGVAAQFGLREMIYTHLVQWTGFAVPLQNMGAFNLYAWQFLWAVGLWLGTGASERVAERFTSRASVAAALVVAVAFFIMRYQLIPYLAAHPVDQGESGLFLFDKWHLGIARVLNFTALGILFASARSYVSRWMAIEPLVVLGQSSLEVFSVHLLFCFAALAWIGDGIGSPFRDQAGVIVVTFTGLYALAYYRLERKRQAKAKVTEERLVKPTEIDFARRAA
jgi:hypothetical protein